MELLGMPSHESTIENLKQIYFLWSKGKLPWDTLPKQSKGIQGLAGISEARMLRIGWPLAVEVRFAEVQLIGWQNHRTVSDWLAIQVWVIHWLADAQKLGFWFETCEWNRFQSLMALTSYYGWGTVSHDLQEKRNFSFSSQKAKLLNISMYTHTHTHTHISMRSTLFTKFQVYNAVLLTISTVLFSKFLGFFFFLNLRWLKLYTHWTATPHFPLPSNPGSDPFTLCFYEFDYFR